MYLHQGVSLFQFDHLTTGGDEDFGLGRKLGKLSLQKLPVAAAPQILVLASILIEVGQEDIFMGEMQHKLRKLTIKR